jgi:hypothetical protein
MNGLNMDDDIAVEQTSGRRKDTREWRRAMASVGPICLLILGLFVYWFAIANRFFVFLYYHDMGPVVPDTTPFSPVTSSRYWMAGLVACGFVLVAYIVANWLLGRTRTGYRPATWWRVWLLCALPLLLAIPILTMTSNAPTLPLANAVQVVVATLTGLAFALVPGQMAAEHPGELAWLAADGWGLMLLLLPLAGLEHLPRWLAGGGTLWIVAIAATTLLGLVWLFVLSVLRTWRPTPVPGGASMFIAGVTVAYLIMPAAHHLFGTDGYFYITNSNNFFTDTVVLQLGIWLLVAIVAVATAQLRRRLITWRAGLSATSM